MRVVLTGLIAASAVLLGTALPVKADSCDVEICRWKNNATAAYSVIHDDFGAWGIEGLARNADTIAYNRGMKVAFGTISKHCETMFGFRNENLNGKNGGWNETGNLWWSYITQASAHGHEIVNHSWSHYHPVGEDAAFQKAQAWYNGGFNLSYDIQYSTDSLKKHLSPFSWQKDITFYVFPYDISKQEHLDAMKMYGYLGARTGSRGVTWALDDFDPFKNINYDAFMPKWESEQRAEWPSSYDGTTDDVEKQYLLDAIAKKGWAFQEMHTVDNLPWGYDAAGQPDFVLDGSTNTDDGGKPSNLEFSWGTCSVDRYRALLDWVKPMITAGTVWMDVPTKVTKYATCRKQLGTPTLSLSGANSIMSFSGEAEAAYAALCTLTVKVTPRTGTYTTLVAKQNSKTLRVTKVGSDFLCYIDPVGGPVTFENVQLVSPVTTTFEYPQPNFVPILGWDITIDAMGTAIDTTGGLVTADVLKLKTTQVASVTTTGSENYADTKISGVGQIDWSKVDSMVVVYKSDIDFMFAAQMAALDTTGENYFMTLAASPDIFKTRVVRFAELAQPEWASLEAKQIPLEKANIFGLSFRPKLNDAAGIANIEIAGIYLYPGNLSAIGPATLSSNLSSQLSVTPLGAKGLALNAASAGVYGVDLIALDGSVIASMAPVFMSAGTHLLPMNLSTIARQMALARISSNASFAVSKVLIGN